MPHQKFGILMNIDQSKMDAFERLLQKRSNPTSIDFRPNNTGNVTAIASFETIEDRNSGAFVVKNLGLSSASRVIKLPEDIR